VNARARSLWIRAAIAVVVVGGAGVWLYSRGDSATAAARVRASSPAAAPATKGGGERVVPVQVAKVERKDLPIWIEGLGTVAAVQQVTVRPQVDGLLQKVMFTEGQAVKKGDVLAQIDPRPFLVQLHQAEGALSRDRSQLAVAKRNVERYQSLHDQNLVAQQQVDQFISETGNLEGSVKIDEAQIENAKLQLDYAAVKAPLDGITGVRQVDAGNLVHTTDPNGIVVVTAINPAAVFFTVPQDRLPQIAAAMANGDVAVRVWNRDNTQELGRGTVAVVDNQINQATASLRLKALVDNPERKLWPNEFVKARMLVETRRDATVVPAVAVQQGPQGNFVYVVGADHTAELRPVQVAITTDDVAMIAKGVQPGEQVVIEGQNQLRPGSRVAVPEAQPARADSTQRAR
jgi:multidrug efflux system membrane fusion protein